MWVVNRTTYFFTCACDNTYASQTAATSSTTLRDHRTTLRIVTRLTSFGGQWLFGIGAVKERLEGNGLGSDQVGRGGKHNQEREAVTKHDLVTSQAAGEAIMATGQVNWVNCTPSSLVLCLTFMTFFQEHHDRLMWTVSGVLRVLMVCNIATAVLPKLYTLS